MAGDIVVIEADPWDPSDVIVEMLQSLVDGGLLRPVMDPVGDIPPGTTRWYMGRTI